MRGRRRPSARCRRHRPGSASAAARRSRSRSVRSASATVRCARCSTSRTVRPRSRISASASKTTSTIVGASPSDGSSSSSTSGSATSARAIASCCCCPPESAPAWRRAELSHDREELVDRGERRRRRSRAARPARPSRRFSSTVSSREDPPALGHERDARAAPRPRARGRASELPVEADLAAVRGHEPHDRVQRRRLAGAVRPDQPDDLAAADARATRPRTAAHAAVADARALSSSSIASAHASVLVHGALAEIRRGDVEVRADLRRRALRRASCPGRAPGCGRRRP